MFSRIFGCIKKFNNHKHSAIFFGYRNFGEQIEAKFIDPKSDLGFKRLFRDELVIKSFISDFLKMNVKEVEFLDTQNDYLVPVSMSVDVKCRTEEGETFIVEMQRFNNKYQANRDFLFKTQVYVANNLLETFKGNSKAIFSSMASENALMMDELGKMKTSYSELKPVHLIAIIAPNKDGLQSYKFFDDEVPFKRYKFLNEGFLDEERNEDMGQKEFPNSLFSLAFLELNKVHLETIKDSHIKEWLECLKDIHLKHEEPAGLTSEGVKRAYSVLDKGKLTPVQQMEMEDKFFEAQVVRMQDAQEVRKEEIIKTIKKDIITYDMLTKKSFTQEEIKKTMSITQDEIDIFSRSITEDEEIIVEEVLPLRMTEIELTGISDSIFIGSK